MFSVMLHYMFWSCLGPHRSCPLSLLDPYCSQEMTEACLYRQAAYAYPCSFHRQSSVGMALSKPPGSRARERCIGLIYTPREAAGKFNDSPYNQHHKAVVSRRMERCHGIAWTVRDIMRFETTVTLLLYNAMMEIYIHTLKYTLLQLPTDISNFVRNQALESMTKCAKTTKEIL